MTVANAITLVRLVAAPLTAYAIFNARTTLAGSLFALAVLTDLVDGIVARRRNEASTFGGLFDHATDATYVTVVLTALVWRGEVPSVLPLLVALAFLQYVLDSRAHVGRALRASRLGRWNGIAYFAVAGAPLVRDALGLFVPSPTWVYAAGWALVVTTVLSMLDRATSRRTAPDSHAAGTGDRSAR